MIKGDILELESRRKIYNFILNNPGLHIREISRRSDISFSTLRHHLNHLEKNDILINKKEGNYNRYYARDKMGKNDKKIMDFLRQDTPRAIILLLFAYVECSLTEISENLEKHPSTISYHLNNMQNMGIVERVFGENGIIDNDSVPFKIKRSQVTNESIYMLKDPELIYNLLIRYKNDLFDNITVGSIVGYVDDFVSDGVPEKILSPKESIDSIAKQIYELFPIPFCA